MLAPHYTVSFASFVELSDFFSNICGSVSCQCPQGLTGYMVRIVAGSFKTTKAGPALFDRFIKNDCD